MDSQGWPSLGNFAPQTGAKFLLRALLQVLLSPSPAGFHRIAVNQKPSWRVRKAADWEGVLRHWAQSQVTMSQDLFQPAVKLS